MAVKRCRPHDPALPVTVVDAAGHRLRIPTWMLSPAAAQYRLCEQAILDAQALRALVELLEGLLEAGFEAPQR